MNCKLDNIRNILTTGFSPEKFQKLSVELFDNVQLKAKVIFKPEKSNFSSHVNRSAHIGDYEDPEGKRIVIYAVELIERDYVANSRSTQRNYAKSIIENNN